MKWIALIILSLFSSFFSSNSAKEVLQKMYESYGGKWFKTFTFTQTTEIYRNDSLIKTATWYEAMIYPDKFRIDFGDISNGNAVIYNKDSAYSFKDNTLKKVFPNDNDLTFLLGGMYFYPLDSVMIKLKQFGYDPAHYYEDSFGDKPVYVIGADSKEEKSSQVWIDKEKLLVVKFIKYENGHKEEGTFGDHKQFGKGWSETSCIFYVDDKLVQKEIDQDCKADDYVDPNVFEPSLFGKVHWYKPKN